MSQNRVARINELAKKSKEVGLTDEEKKEQQVLRSEYIAAFKGNLKSTLDTIVVVDELGNKNPLQRKLENPPS